MRWRVQNLILVGLLFASMCIVVAGQAVAETPTKDTPDPGTVLSQQVWALQSLHDLDLDTRQLQALRLIIPKPDEETPHAHSGKVPAAFLEKLKSLRKALLREGNSDDASDEIDELRDDLESIREDEQVEVDDRVKISSAARTITGDVMKLLRPSQLAGYLSTYQDEVPDPVQNLVDAAKKSRGMEEEKFDTLATQTSRDASILVSGLNSEKCEASAARIVKWMHDIHNETEADFTISQKNLEASAREAAGEFDSFEVLRHWVERDVAELLSNRQTGAMIDEKLKQVRSEQ